ncbi:MAG: aspartate/glutamate racemase family protein [Clostridia bacterium]|nr:aspartate/glutamate racemase family protein [Clostridia bacterium]
MKTIGLIGGMSWESTIPYYRIINEVVKERLGGLHSARCILYSVEFAEIEALQASGGWAESGEILGNAARKLQEAGADFIVICTNTMHKVAPQVQSMITIPLLHIAEVTALKLKESNINKVALLGTKYTMLQDFYKAKVEEKEISVLIPNENDIEFINGVIFNELCLGIIKAESKQEFLRVIKELSLNGAQGVILGCTEIGLLVKQEDTDVPLFDTTFIHAKAAAIAALTE